MSDWWKSRDSREQLLLLSAGALTLVLLIVQLALIPSHTFRERARSAFDREVAVGAEVDRALARRGVVSSFVEDGRPLQAIISDAANVFGLEVNRMTPADGGALNLWLEAEAPQSLYAWLADLETSYRVRVSKASIRWNSDQTTVSATLTVKAGI